MDGKRISLHKQSWKTWLKDFINYTKGPFMDVVDFIIKTSTMTHPAYWTIMKLWSDELLHENAGFCKLMYLETLVNACSVWLALEQMLVTCSLKVRSPSILTPNNTSCLFIFIVDPSINIGLSMNALSKKLNYPRLALKPLWWNHFQILDISLSSFLIMSSNLRL